MKKDHSFVRHMIDAIDEIQTFLEGRTYEESVQDPLRMHACMRLFEIIGEAANQLSEEFCSAQS